MNTLRGSVLLVMMLWVNRLPAQDWKRVPDSLLSIASQSALPSVKVDMLTRASLAYLFHNPDTALLLADEAIALAEKSRNDTLMAMAYAGKSAVYVIRDENKPVLEYALKGLEISERTSLPPDVMASLYRKTGYVYRNTNDNEKSIEAYKQAIAWSTKSNNLYDVSGTLPNLGQLYFKIKKTDSALYYHQEGLRIAKEQGYADFIVRAYINIINVYKSIKQFEKGLAAAAELAPWLMHPAVTPIVKGLAYTSIADLDLRKGNAVHPLAQRYLDSMNILLKKLKPGTENVMNYHLNRALYEFSVQHYDSASAALVRYHEFKDVYDNEILAGHTQELSARYETGKKEQQIQTLDKESRLRKLLLLIAVGVAAVFLGLLFFVWRQKQQIKKQEQKLGYLMKELHHRVKNNLQIVSSLLSLQSHKVEDEQAQKALQEGQHRIEAMSLIHRKLYQTDIVSRVNIGEFIHELTESLLHAYGYTHDNFSLSIDCGIKELDADIAIPAGLILNEAVTNAFKYAYTNTAHPSLQISLQPEGERLVMRVTDNGRGFSAESWKRSASFGKQIMQSLVKQIGGAMQAAGGNETVFTFTFPAKNSNK